MRILQLHNLHKAGGGALHVMEQEAELLSSAGHDVDQLLEPAATTSGQGALRMGAASIWNSAASRELSTKIGQFDPDVVHVHTPFPTMSPVVFRTARRLGRPTVTTVHGYRYSCVGGLCLRDGNPCEDCVGSKLKLSGIRHKCYHGSVAASTTLTISLVTHRALGTFSKDVDRYIALTDFTRELLIRDGFPADKVIVKPNAVPDPGHPVPQSERKPYALFVGRLTEEKGVRTLLNAWSSVATGVQLYVAGDGPLGEIVVEAATANPSIHALGWCAPEKVTELMAHASITIVPSEWYEAGPLVILQSLAAGTPVLTSDLPNLCDSLRANGAGRAFVTRDPDSLASIASEMLSHESERQEMGVRARVLYERQHTPSRALESLESIYRSVLPPMHRQAGSPPPEPAKRR